jgi:hypothetical protein
MLLLLLLPSLPWWSSGNVLSNGPKFCGFKPTDELSRAIKMHSTTANGPMNLSLMITDKFRQN